jgi:cell division protein FtsI (penicillin-binding protein 3)
VAAASFHKRLKALGVLVVLAGSVVTARLLWLQVVRYMDFRQMARRQQLTPREVRAERGLIVDRGGVPLAVNVDLFNVYAHPAQVKDKRGTAAALAKALGLPQAVVLRRLQSAENFVWIARQVPYERSNAVEKLDFSGVGAYREQRRFYPDRDMAGHVLGFTGTDNQGLKGLESRFDRLLTGESGRVVLERDAKRNAVLARSGSKEARDGLTVVTTLDRVIQHVTQIELEKAFNKYRCRSASAIVMDPKTGEILAMANLPSFDPNHYKSYSFDERQNRSVDYAFEPGSTFKIVPLAAAIEEGVLNEDDRIFCENGKKKFAYNRVVTDHEKHGWITLREVFGYSSNIGMVKVGEKLGKETLYSWSKRFGFGVSTGVDLPGEARGVLAPPDKWTGFTMTSVPYGYEVSASPLQVVCAYAAVAYGGTMMRPFLVQRLEDKDGRVVREFEPQKLRKVCSAKTAKRLTALLRWVVDKGTGTQVKLEDYSVAGKTGTAHMLMNGKYSQNNYVSSFVGFVPAEDPRFVIYVSMEDPRGVYWRGRFSGKWLAASWRTPTCHPRAAPPRGWFPPPQCLPSWGSRRPNAEPWPGPPDCPFISRGREPGWCFNRLERAPSFRRVKKPFRWI